jgi:hypothetical protein
VARLKACAATSAVVALEEAPVEPQAAKSSADAHARSPHLVAVLAIRQGSQS